MKIGRIFKEFEIFLRSKSHNFLTKGSIFKQKTKKNYKRIQELFAAADFSSKCQDFRNWAPNLLNFCPGERLTKTSTVLKPRAFFTPTCQLHGFNKTTRFFQHQTFCKMHKKDDIS